ncbi:hypothetical protein [Cystobacter ferrugineus]|uniref:hypothetical protein n=1 Tax=Cystobacter ferrugineus TaxID=83449 RepID=UPI000AFD4FE4|nr:hypothetical protein [Cystobacter ferrugineus]
MRSWRRTGNNDFVERDELGLLEGMSVKFKPSPDGGMLLLLNDQPIGSRVP